MAKFLHDGGASGVLYLDRRQFYLNPNKVAELTPDVTPFTTLLNFTQEKKPSDPLFKLFEHRPYWKRQTFGCNGIHTIADDNTAVNVTIDTATIKGLDKNLNESYEGLEVEVWNSAGDTKKGIALVIAYVDSTTLSMKSMGGSISLVAGDYFVVVSNAKGEGQYSKEAWSDDLQVVYNSTQIFEVPVEVTGTLYQASLRGYNNELARLRAEKMKEFKMQREHGFLKGGSVLGTGMDGTQMTDTYRTDKDGKPVRTTMGLIPIIEKYGSTSGDNQNIFSISEATYDYRKMIDQFELVFENNTDGDTKFAFTGRGALGYWSKLIGASGIAGNSGWNIELSDMKRSKLGFNVRILETPHGVLHLIPTRALKNEYNKTMVCVDHNNLFHATYRPMKFENDIKKDNGYDGVKDRYWSDEGIGVTLVENHQLFKIVA